MTHALLSPSSAHRWIPCPASVALEHDLPEDSSDFADEGIAAHALAADVLTHGVDPHSAVGEAISVDGAEVIVTDEMAQAVSRYADYVRSLGGTLMVEQKLPLAELTGEDADGTADAVVALADELIVVDLKYGRGVRVDAPGNEQLRMYALAALRQFEALGDFKRVRMVIVQPRLEHISEDDCRVDELAAFLPELWTAAERARGALDYWRRSNGAVHQTYMQPGEKQCRFCRAKAICPALANFTLASVAGDFVDVSQPIAPQIPELTSRLYDNDTLGRLLAAVPLVEAWCIAVRAKAEAELLAGHVVPGYKLVEGRRGARKWANEVEVESTLKTMRLRTEEMYDLSLISPTTAEKLTKKNGEDGKPIIGPRQWPKLQSLITQPDGKPSVAVETDKRPALVMQASADEFENEQESLV